MTGTGSFATGVIVSDGLVLTSRHMVADQTELSVLPRGHGDVANLSSRHLARVVRQNVFTDLALLQLDPPLLAPVALAISASDLDPAPGEQVQVFSHDRHQTWQHERAVVVEVNAEHTWFSGGNTLHRGPTIHLEIKSSFIIDGAPVLNHKRELVGLKVQSGPGERAITGVSAVAIRAFLNPRNSGG